MATKKTQRALDLAAEKGSSAWLTVLPLQDLGFNLNKREWMISPPHVLVGKPIRLITK